MTDVPSHLTMRFPAGPGYLSISRVTTTALAAANGFNVDELDEIRLAIDEVVAWLLHAGEAVGAAGSGVDDHVELDITCKNGNLEFTAVRPTADSAVPTMTELAQAVLAVTVDDHDTGIDDRNRRFVTLVKRASVHA